MNILFIRPKPSPETIGLQHLMIVEPLELEILATLVKDINRVKIVDMILEKKPLEFFLRDFNPGIVCVTGYITHIPRMIQCCSESKKINPSVITVVGGVHVEKYPEDIDHEAIDYRVVRNATRTFPRLVEFLVKGSPFPQGVLKMNERMDEKLLPPYDFYVPVPDRSLTSPYRKKYFYVYHNRVALLKTSFGCPYTCDFCYCRIITGDKYFARPLQEVTEELTGIREKEIYIVDDDFLVNASRIREFLHLLKKEGIRKRYLVYGRADFIAANPELIREFRELGLRTIIVGLESFEDPELAGYNKKTTRRINEEAMAVLNKYRVDCYAAIIIPPHWSRQDFENARKEMLGLGIKFINLQPLTPLKGTNLENYDDRLVIDRKDYAKWDLAHVTIRPEKMSLPDFYDQILQLYLKVILHSRNILSNLKYPIHMQIKMAAGMRRVRNQYKTRIMEAVNHA